MKGDPGCSFASEVWNTLCEVGRFGPKERISNNSFTAAFCCFLLWNNSVSIWHSFYSSKTTVFLYISDNRIPSLHCFIITDVQTPSCSPIFLKNLAQNSPFSLLSFWIKVIQIWLLQSPRHTLKICGNEYTCVLWLLPVSAIWLWLWGLHSGISVIWVYE